MDSKFKFFEHKECEYYPCHNLEEINCMFCYCPLMALDCSEYGNPEYITRFGGTVVKDCSNCSYPHVRENYGEIMKKLTELTTSDSPVKLDKFIIRKGTS